MFDNKVLGVNFYIDILCVIYFDGNNIFSLAIEVLFQCLLVKCRVVV